MGPREAELTADCQVLRTLATQVGICHPSGSGGQRRGQASPRWLGSLVYALWTVAGRADLNAQLRAWLAIAVDARPWRVLGSAPTDRTTADRVARLVLPPDARASTDGPGRGTKDCYVRLDWMHESLPPA
jgi:hypothetical protein